jgi:hypothetical protein
VLVELRAHSERSARINLCQQHQAAAAVRNSKLQQHTAFAPNDAQSDRPVPAFFDLSSAGAHAHTRMHTRMSSHPHQEWACERAHLAQQEAPAYLPPHHCWRNASVSDLDNALGRTCAHSAQLSSKLNLPVHALFLPPPAHAAMAERHEHDVLHAQGVGDSKCIYAWQRADDVMRTRTTEDMLYAAGAMAESSVSCDMRAESATRPYCPHKAPSAHRLCVFRQEREIYQPGTLNLP